MYEVSNLGRIKSLVRTGSDGRILKEKIMNPSTNNTGYKQIALSDGRSRIKYCLHRIVAEAFVFNENPGIFTDANHIDENKNNNKACNLEWMTRRQNKNYSSNKKSSSKYPGVSWNSRNKRWISQCNVKNKKYYLGSFINEKDAAIAYSDFCSNNGLV